jgi:hypothetical protein
MFQVVERSWPAGAVHDSVVAVVRASEFRRSLQSSIGERLLLWLGEWIGRAVRFLRGTSSARTIALAVAALLVAVVVTRLVVGARLREGRAERGGRLRGVGRGEDPWRAAERLARDGRYEDAAHALYHAVLTSLAQSDRLRLDPSMTSGDYARELRHRGSQSYRAFRAFARRFDVGVFGHGECDAGFIDELRRLAEPFAPRGARAA